jgi:hypothetical protein
MKNLIVALLFLGPVTAMACANFAGSFTCTEVGDNYTYNLTVEQNGNIFTITDDEGVEEFVADGNRRTIPDNTNMRNAYYVAACQGQSVVLQMAGEIYDDESGQSFPFQANMNHQSVNRDHVTQTTVTQVLGQTTTTTTQCRRN